MVHERVRYLINSFVQIVKSFFFLFLSFLRYYMSLICKIMFVSNTRYDSNIQNAFNERGTKISNELHRSTVGNEAFGKIRTRAGITVGKSKKSTRYWRQIFTRLCLSQKQWVRQLVSSQSKIVPLIRTFRFHITLT